jgi:hypothetical protein
MGVVNRGFLLVGLAMPGWRHAAQLLCIFVTVGLFQGYFDAFFDTITTNL